MQSRRDLVAAHAFVRHRLRSALLRCEPDAPQTPLRRTALGIGLSVIVSILALVVVGVIGFLLHDSGDSWKATGTLVVDKQTGSRYLMIDGSLHPVLNFASAALAVGKPPAVATVDSTELTDIPRGVPLGIPGAPDSLPSQDTDHEWQVCPVRSSTSARSSITIDPTSAPSPSTHGSTAIVKAGNGSIYLAASGTRMRITADWVPLALGLEKLPVVPVPDLWLNALNAGPDIGGVVVTGRGGPGPSLDGNATRIGEVLVNHTPGASDRYYVTTGDGLAPIGRSALWLLLGDPASRTAYSDHRVEAVPVSTSALDAAHVVATPTSLRDVPALPHGGVAPPAGGSVPCVTVTTGHSKTAASVRWTRTSDVGMIQPTGEYLRTDSRTADYVGVGHGDGIYARTAPVVGVGGAGVFVVSPGGVKFGVPNAKSQTALGLHSDIAVQVPPALLAALPTGPTLAAPRGGGS